MEWLNCGKGDKEREVYFNIRCEIWLKRYLDNRQDKDPAIFVTERYPQRMSIAQMRYIIKRISNRAGINKEIHLHQLRHSYATHLLNNGNPLDVIQSLLGMRKVKPHVFMPNLGEVLDRTFIGNIFERKSDASLSIAPL